MGGGGESRRWSAAALATRAEAWLTPLYKGLAALAAAAGASIVGLIGASVAMRHIANAPFRFTEELVGLLMTAAFFLALPYATLRSEHVRLQILVSAAPPRIARWVTLAAGLFGVGFCVWFAHLSWPWLSFAIDRSIKTEVARLLLYPWMALAPASMILTATAFLIRAAAGQTAPSNAPARAEGPPGSAPSGG